MKKIIFLNLLLILLVWFLYYQTGEFEFIRLDDHDYTFRCLFVRDGLSFSNIVESFVNLRHAAIWMPVTYISYMADITFFGNGMKPHHLINVAIHSLNAVLAFCLFLSLFKKNSAASHDIPKNSNSQSGQCCGFIMWVLLSAVMIWAIHPQRVEPVAWIAGRKELLCAFFTILGLNCWIRSGYVRIWGGIFCCILACLSKPTGICFPFLAFAMDVLNRKVQGLSPSFSAPSTLRSALKVQGLSPSPSAPSTLRSALKVQGLSPSFSARYALHFVPMLIVSFVTGAIAIYSQTHPEGMGELAVFTASFHWRILNAAVAIGLYIAKFFVPTGIYLDYRAAPEEFPIDGVIGLTVFILTAVLFVIAVIKLRRLRRKLFAWSVFFIASLVPTLGVFGSFGEQARADRFIYLPSLAILGIILSLICDGDSPCIFSAERRVQSAECDGDSPCIFSAERRVQSAECDGDSPCIFRADRREQSAECDGDSPCIFSAERRVQSAECDGDSPCRKWMRRAVTGMFGIVVIVFLFASFPIVASYKNDYTVFSRTLKFDGNHGRALAHVASEECARFGHIDKGILLYRRSHELRPRDDTAAQLAYTLALRGNASDYTEIRRLCSKFACDHSLDRKGMALEALGTTAMRQRRWKEAVSCLRDSVNAPARFYSSEDALLRLAACLANSNDSQNAVKIFEALTKSTRMDISSRASQFLRMLKNNPNSVILF